MNTSFRQRVALLMASEAHRDAHGIPLRFRRASSAVPAWVVRQIETDIAAAVADLDGVRGMALRLRPQREYPCDVEPAS